MSLSEDVHHHIFSYLSPRDLSQLALASKDAYDIVSRRRIHQINTNKGRVSNLNLNLHEIEQLLRNYGENLHSLSLNQLNEDTALRFIQHCPNIQLLRLSTFKGIGYNLLQTITKMKRLTSLKMSICEINSGGASLLAQMKNLRSLNLWGNNIGYNGAKSLSRMKGLENLNLSYNNIGDEGAKALAEMIGLESLILEINKISDEGAKALARMIGLKRLNLHANAIGDEGAKAIAEMIGLESLNLDKQQPQKSLIL